MQFSGLDSQGETARPPSSNITTFVRAISLNVLGLASGEPSRKVEMIFVARAAEAMPQSNRSGALSVLGVLARHLSYPRSSQEVGPSGGNRAMTDKSADQRAAIDRAFRDESAMILRWLTAKLGDKHDAQDVLQSVYLRTLSFAAEHSIDNAKALIFRIAAHLAVDELRRRRRVQTNFHVAAGIDEEDLALSVRSDLPNSEAALIAREELDAVVKALDKLPRNVKTAFLMNRVYGDTYAEIAAELGVSVSSVEKYMIKALATLRKFQRKQSEESAEKAIVIRAARPSSRTLSTRRKISSSVGVHSLAMLRASHIG